MGTPFERWLTERWLKLCLDPARSDQIVAEIAERFNLPESEIAELHVIAKENLTRAENMTATFSEPQIAKSLSQIVSAIANELAGAAPVSPSPASRVKDYEL